AAYSLGTKVSDVTKPSIMSPLIAELPMITHWLAALLQPTTMMDSKVALGMMDRALRSFQEMVTRAGTSLRKIQNSRSETVPMSFTLSFTSKLPERDSGAEGSSKK